MKKKENRKAIILKSLINKLEERLNKLEDEISEKRKELKSICIHDETEILEHKNYNEFTNNQEIIKLEVCKICGKEINKIINVL